MTSCRVQCVANDQSKKKQRPDLPPKMVHLDLAHFLLRPAYETSFLTNSLQSSLYRTHVQSLTYSSQTTTFLKVNTSVIIVNFQINS